MLDFLLIPSLLTLGYSLIFIFFPQKTSNKVGFFFCIITFLICLIFIGFRGEYGTDFDSYNSLFKGRLNPEQFGLVFQAISNLINSMFFWDGSLKSLFGFLIIFVFYTAFLLLLSREFKELKYFVFLYLFSIMIFPNLLGSVRQGIAMLIFFYAIILVLEKQPIKSFSFSFFAANIHLGSSIGILASLFTKYFYIVIFVFSIIFLLAGNFYYEFILDKLIHYYEFSLPNSSSRILDPGKIIFLPFVIYTFFKYLSPSSFLALIFFASTILSRLIFGDIFGEIVSRMGPYFDVYKFILLKILLEKREWLVIQVLVFLMSLSIFPKLFSHIARWESYFDFQLF
mgnify:CR=1 FL=1